MSRMKKILSLLFCLGFLSFGCGSDDDDDATATPAKIFCDDSTGESKGCMEGALPACATGTKVDACPASSKGKCSGTTIEGSSTTFDWYIYDTTVAEMMATACSSTYKGTWSTS